MAADLVEKGMQGRQISVAQGARIAHQLAGCLQPFEPGSSPNS